MANKKKREIIIRRTKRFKFVMVARRESGPRQGRRGDGFGGLWRHVRIVFFLFTIISSSAIVSVMFLSIFFFPPFVFYFSSHFGNSSERSDRANHLIICRPERNEHDGRFADDP